MFNFMYYIEQPECMNVRVRVRDETDWCPIQPHAQGSQDRFLTLTRTMQLLKVNE